MHLHMVSMGWKWATLGSILEEGRAGLAFLHFTQCHSEVKKQTKNSGSTRSEGIMANIDVFTVRMTLNLLFKSGPDGWCKHSCMGPAWGALSMGLVPVQMPPHQHCSGAHHSSAASPASGPLCPSLCRRCRCCRSSSSPPADLGRNAQSPLTLERPSLQKASH